MSKQFILNLLGITIIGVFTGYGVTHVFLNQNSDLYGNPLRTTASINQNRTLTKIAAHQIYQDYFEVRIKHEHISEDGNQTSIVKAVLTAKKDLPAGLQYKWILGESVTASASHIDGTLKELKQGEQIEIPLIVYGFNKSAQTYLSFVIDGVVDSHKLHKEVLSSSRPEDSFEYVVQQAHAAEQEQRRANQKVETQSSRSKKFDLKKVIK